MSNVFGFSCLELRNTSTERLVLKENLFLCVASLDEYEYDMIVVAKYYYNNNNNNNNNNYNNYNNNGLYLTRVTLITIKVFSLVAF